MRLLELISLNPYMMTTRSKHMMCPLRVAI